MLKESGKYPPDTPAPASISSSLTISAQARTSPKMFELFLLKIFAAKLGRANEEVVISYTIQDMKGMGTKKSFSKFAFLIEVVMLFLALVSGYLLLLEFTTSLTSQQIQLFDTIDLGIALAFLCEFAVNFFVAKKQLKFFIFHWWELLAAIPITVPLTQALRLLRLLRLLHLAQSVAD